MSKKILIFVLLVVAALATGVWFARIDLLLALVKFRSESEYVVAPNKALPWDKGPQTAQSEAQAAAPEYYSHRCR